MIRAVLFDLFETLVTESAAHPPGASSLGPDLRIDDATFHAAWALRWPAVVLGHLSFREALNDIGRSAGCELAPATVEQAREARIRTKAAVIAHIEPEVLHAVSALCDGGLRVSVVSNCFAEDVVGWDACSLAPMFTHTVWSFEVGLAKPDLAMYQLACAELGLRPDETVFVGDSPDELQGAEQAGIAGYQALWFLRRWAHFEPAAVVAHQLSTPKDLASIAQ